MDTSDKQRTTSPQFRILEKLSNKVNPKKNIYRHTWNLESDKNLGAGGWGLKKGMKGIEENLRE